MSEKNTSTQVEASTVYDTKTRVEMNENVSGNVGPMDYPVHIIGLSGRWQSGKDTVARMFIQHLQQSGRFRNVYTRAFAGPLKRILRYLRPDLQLSDMETEVGKNSPLPKRHAQYAPSFEGVLSHALDMTEMTDLSVQPSAHIATAATKLQEATYKKTVDELKHAVLEAIQRFEYLVDQEKIRTVGQALQQLGTDCFRNMVVDNFWIACQRVLLSMQYASASACDARAKKDVIIYTDVRFPNEYDYITVNQGIPMRILRNVDYTKSTRDPNHPSEIALEKHSFKWWIDNRHTLENTEQEIIQLVPKLFVPCK